MPRLLLPALTIYTSLLLATPSVQAQPILKRVEEMLRNQLGDARAAEPGAPVTERGYLGMIGDDTPDNSGVVVLEVYPGQAAAQGGLATGDVITAVDGQIIRTMDELVRSALDKPVGTKLNMTVSRNGAAQKLEIALGRRPADPGEVANELPAPDSAPNLTAPNLVPPSGPKLGVRSVAVTPDVQQQHNLAEAAGAHVIYVAPDSPAAKANVPLGAVITAVDRQPVKTPEELASAVRNSTDPAIELTYVHAGRTQRVVANLAQSGDAPPALVETQARRAQGGAAAAPSEQPTPQPAATPLPPQPKPPVSGSTVEDRLEALLDRIEKLERRIETMEAKLPSP